MIFKIFYQPTKDLSPKRERTQAIYLEVDAKTELEGRIAVRRLVEDKTAYNIEFIEHLSEKHLAHEQETGAFELTEL